jgi:hypothetical protein
MEDVKRILKFLLLGRNIKTSPGIIQLVHIHIDMSAGN